MVQGLQWDPSPLGGLPIPMETVPSINEDSKGFTVTTHVRSWVPRMAGRSLTTLSNGNIVSIMKRWNNSNSLRPHQSLVYQIYQHYLCYPVNNPVTKVTMVTMNALPDDQWIPVDLSVPVFRGHPVRGWLL